MVSTYKRKNTRANCMSKSELENKERKKIRDL